MIDACAFDVLLGVPERQRIHPETDEVQTSQIIGPATGMEARLRR